MLSVNLCGQPIPTKKSALAVLHVHRFFLKKNPNFHKILNVQPFPNSISCLLQSVELNPQTDKDSLDGEGPEKQEEKVDLYTVNYLINACGLSEEEAISVTKKLGMDKRLSKLNREENADSVLDLLRAYGFSSSQISLAVKRHPHILLSRPYKTILPKLDFFQSLGFKRDDGSLVDLLSENAFILKRSLKRRLIPNYNILKNVYDWNHDMIYATMKNSLMRIMQDDLSRTLVPNLEALRDAGVSKSRINYLVVKFPLTVLQKHSQFRKNVIQLQKMEFDPSSVKFIYGIIVLSRKNGAVWNRAYEVFLELGSSSDEIVSAFRTNPFCMLITEEKIKKVMDRVVNEMGWPYSDIINKPRLFKFSLEKRIIPRCSVVLFLHSNGVLKRLPKLSSILEVTVNYFVKRFVTRYAKVLPEVLQIYNGKLNFLGN